MLRTAIGAITSWLDDPAIVEIIFNPDGRLGIDRLGGALSDTGTRLSAKGIGRPKLYAAFNKRIKTLNSIDWGSLATQHCRRHRSAAPGGAALCSYRLRNPKSGGGP
jgi:Flp pilus assembly CpaF family ATPase